VPVPPASSAAAAADDEESLPVDGALLAAAVSTGAEPGARVVPLGPPPPVAEKGSGAVVAAVPPPPANKGLFGRQRAPPPPPPSHHLHHHPHFQLHAQHFASNAIKTAKYNAFTFLPRFLFEMFSRAAYLYFLLQAVLSWIPVVSPFGGWGSTLALLFVLLVAAVKALFEDVKRHQQDRATNASKARVVVVAKNPSSGFSAPNLSTSSSSSVVETKEVEWRDLHVGDVVRVDDGELFPADLVCLHSALEDDVCFIKTTNLDGENNLKIRRPVDVSDAFPTSSSSSTAKGDGDNDDAPRPSASDVLSLRGALTAEAPNANLHVFKGRLALEVPAEKATEEKEEKEEKKSGNGNGDGDGDGESATTATAAAPNASTSSASPPTITTTKTVPVTINEVLLRGCLLKNTGHVFGLVVYTGKESRIQMNAAATPSKVGSYDHFLNFQIALVMALQLALCVFSAACGAAWRELAGKKRPHLGMDDPSEGNIKSPVLYAGVLFVTFWILYSYLVPISLFVTLEIVKFWQGFVYVNWDEGMRDPATGDYALARNTSLIEDLGKVDYIFSDKTGTLTSNEMQLRQIAVKDSVYGRAEFRLEEWQKEGSGEGGGNGSGGELDWCACARAWDPRAAAAAEALTADGISWKSLVASGGSGRRTLALHSSKSEAALALASAAAGAGAAAGAASDETRGKSKSRGNGGEEEEEEEGEEVTSSAAPAARNANKVEDEDEDDDSRDPALLGAHLVDFWTNVCVCHSLIVEPASSSAAAASSNPSSASDAAAKTATTTAATTKAAPPSSSSSSSAPPPPSQPSRPVYQGPSPDEVALVEAARAVGYEFVGRSAGGVVLDLLGARVVYEVLAVLEYSSARARMSVVARAPDGTVRLFCKGADARVLGMLRRGEGHERLLAATERNLRAFAQRGLRTLALATKVVEPDAWSDWHARYRAAGSLLDGRDEALAELADEVERELEFVGVTAIEDKLQEGVPEAIESLLAAGAKVWVITGDKRETATNIAVSCNLVRRPEALLVLDAASSEGAAAELERACAELEGRGMGPVVAAGSSSIAAAVGSTAAAAPGSTASPPSSPSSANANFGLPAELVIDGATLSHILGDPPLEARLAAVGALCSSVVVCRSSPSQKAGIVRMMREHEAATAGAGKRWRLTRWYARQMRKQSG